MFLCGTRMEFAARLAVLAGGVLGLTGAATAADGTRVSISIGSGPRVVTECVRERDYAGTLTIDGRCFRIDTTCDVREQIRDAFRRSGYDAWIAGRSVRVRKECDGPEVCWRNGDYEIEFRERAVSLALTPIDGCAHDAYGRGVRYCLDREHRRYGSYREVCDARGRTSWVSLGFAVFIDHARDGHHEGRADRAPRTDDRSPRDHGSRGVDRPRRDDHAVRPPARAVDDLSSQPKAQVQPAKRPVSATPPEREKSQVLNRITPPDLKRNAPAPAGGTKSGLIRDRVAKKAPSPKGDGDRKSKW